MKKIDIVSLVFYGISGILFVPVSVFSFFMMMASESTMGATNPVYIGLVDVFCVISFLVPIFWLVGIILSLVFRVKDRSVLSFVLQFLGPSIFTLNFLLLAIADMIPKVI